MQKETHDVFGNDRLAVCRRVSMIRALMNRRQMTGCWSGARDVPHRPLGRGTGHQHGRPRGGQTIVDTAVELSAVAQKRDLDGPLLIRFRIFFAIA